MSYLYNGVNISNLIVSGSSNSNTYVGFPSFTAGNNSQSLGNQNLSIFGGVSNVPVLAKYNDYLGINATGGDFVGNNGWFKAERESYKVDAYMYLLWYGDYLGNDTTYYFRAGNTTNYSLTLESNTRLIRCMIIGGGGGGGGGAANNGKPGGGRGGGGGTIYVELPIGTVKTLTLGVGNGGYGGLKHSGNDNVGVGWSGGRGGSSYVTYNGETYRAYGGFGGAGGLITTGTTGGGTEVPNTSSANVLYRSNGNGATSSGNNNEDYFPYTAGNSNFNNIVSGFTEITYGTGMGGERGLSTGANNTSNGGGGGYRGFVRIIQII